MLVVAVHWKGLSGLGATLGAAAAASSVVLWPVLLMHSLFWMVAVLAVMLMGVTRAECWWPY